MLYCFKFRKITGSKNPKFGNIDKGKLMLLSKYAMFDRRNRDLWKSKSGNIVNYDWQNPDTWSIINIMII